MRRRRDDPSRAEFGVPDPLLDRILRDPLPVTALEDRRYFHPLQEFAPPVAYPRDAARIRAKSSPVGSTRNDVSARVGFAVPERVAVCVRRKQRREVIHALGRGGGGGSRRRRRNFWSDVDCK